MNIEKEIETEIVLSLYSQAKSMFRIITKDKPISALSEREFARPVMTNKQWEDLTLKDKEVLNALGILDLVKPKKKNKTPKNKTLPPLEPYILKRITTCHICKTISTAYFKMIPAAKRFLTGVKIEQKDILPLDIIKEVKDRYLGCSNCYKVLGKQSKKELIRKIIKLSGGKVNER